MLAALSVRAMQIEQAMYGEYRGGHSLLASSKDDAVSAGIVQRLDLPDTAPPGVEWSPFLRGFPYRDRYVISRTFRDTGASRGGMVFSHALFARLNEIVETPDLRPLLNLFATSDRQRPDVATVELTCTETQLPHANELVGAAEALGMNGRLPVVRLGHIGFDDLVVALWARLLPEIRRGFAFRLSFDPRDLVETPGPGAGMHATIDGGTLDRVSGHPFGCISRTGLVRRGDPERSREGSPAHRVHAGDGSEASGRFMTYAWSNKPIASTSASRR